MRVLVTYGSSRGGTKGLAEMVADSLRDFGLDVQVLPPTQIHDLSSYDAVVVGGAVYAFRWHRAARRFVRKHAGALRRRPTYFFSSGPLDDSAALNNLAPVPGVKKLMERAGARGHATFGGRLSPEARGFPASAMAKTQSGDLREPARVRAWALQIAQDLMGEPAEEAQSHRQSMIT
jgi:menaquinone-dependent protoporphyrinogen oxidase